MVDISTIVMVYQPNQNWGGTTLYILGFVLRWCVIFPAGNLYTHIHKKNLESIGEYMNTIYIYSCMKRPPDYVCWSTYYLGVRAPLSKWVQNKNSYIYICIYIEYPRLYMGDTAYIWIINHLLSGMYIQVFWLGNQNITEYPFNIWLVVSNIFYFP